MKTDDPILTSVADDRSRYSCKVYDTIRDVDPLDWANVCQTTDQNEFMEFRFLVVLESTMSDQAKFWYAIFRDDKDCPIACACISKLRIDVFVIGNQIVKRFVNRVRKAWPGLGYINIVMCGLPLSIGKSHILFSAGSDSQEVLRLLDNAMLGIAQNENAELIVHKEYAPAERARMDGLMAYDYIRAKSLPMYTFSPHYSDFDEYRSALKSHYRYDITRSMRKFDNSGLTVSRLVDADAIRRVYTDNFHKLYEAVVSHSENKLEILPAEFFRQLACTFPKEVSLTLVHSGNKVAAYMFSFATGSAYYFLFCGLDYQLNRQGDVYFNLMYNELDYALKEQAQEIHMGQTADSFKARLGCAATPRFIYVKGIGRIYPWVLRHFFAVIFSTPKEASSYNIYKQTGR